jgi:hypothetical protein
VRKLRRVLLLFVVVVSLAFAATSGPNFAGTSGTSGTCNGTTTFCWSNPGNITANDGVKAQVGLGASGASNELQGTNFGFAIPTGSTINGITVEIWKQALTGPGNPTDVDVTILKGGVATGTNLGHTGAGNGWLSAGAIDTYGGVSNLWGTTWAPADINSTSFGVRISCVEWTGGATTTAAVDFIRITITYTPPAPPPAGGKHRVIQTQTRRGLPLIAVAVTQRNSTFIPTMEQS